MTASRSSKAEGVSSPALINASALIKTLVGADQLIGASIIVRISTDQR